MCKLSVYRKYELQEEVNLFWTLECWRRLKNWTDLRIGWNYSSCLAQKALLYSPMFVISSPECNGLCGCVVLLLHHGNKDRRVLQCVGLSAGEKTRCRVTFILVVTQVVLFLVSSLPHLLWLPSFLLFVSFFFYYSYSTSSYFRLFLLYSS